MITGADSLLAADRLVLLGEVHGMRQVPEAVVELARGFVGPLRVGIEWPSALQPVVDEIFAGGAIDTSHELWRYGDGRSSAAMIAMIAALRSRPDSRVFAFDHWGEGERDEGMAANVLAAYDADPHAAFLVLAGNLHTRTLRADAPYEPMGEYLAAQLPVVAFDAIYRRGTTWNLTMDEPIGRPHPVRGPDRGDAPFVRWFARPDERGYDGELYLGDVEASPPYVA